MTSSFAMTIDIQTTVVIIKIAKRLNVFHSIGSVREVFVLFTGGKCIMKTHIYVSHTIKVNYLLSCPTMKLAAQLFSIFRPFIQFEGLTHFGYYLKKEIAKSRPWK